MNNSIYLPPSGSRILVRLPNWIGDVLLSEPLIAVIRERRPDLKLTALVKKSCLQIARLLPHFEEVLVLEGTSLPLTLRTASRLKEMSFDSCLVIPKGFREALLARLSGIPVRIGLDTDRRSRLLTHPIHFSTEDWNDHHSLQFGKLLHAFGFELDNREAKLSPTPSAKEEAAALLHTEGIAGGYAVFHIAASKFPRAWHSGRFGEVAQRLSETKDLTPVLIGTEREAAQHSDFIRECPRVVDLTGKTDLETMAALLSESSLFVGNDSGPMHLAAAVGTPVAAVFGPGAPRKTIPRRSGRSCMTVYADLPCSPCSQRFWRDCSPADSGKPACLEAIDPESVLSVCFELLK